MLSLKEPISYFYTLIKSLQNFPSPVWTITILSASLCMLQVLDNLFGSLVDLLQYVQFTLILGSLGLELQACLTWTEQRKRITLLVIIYLDNEKFSYIHIYILQEITVFKSSLDSLRKWMLSSFQVYYLESKKMFIANLK